MNYKTEQEAFWAGTFGDEYIRRNNSSSLVASNTALFSRILNHTTGVHSVIEFGANIGMNLLALRQLLPDAELEAVEINHTAATTLREWHGCSRVNEVSILDYEVTTQFDLAFSKGVLIHINPDQLPIVYDKLHAASRRYVLIAEYYNPSPVEVTYRGHQGRLFKRDFAGEFADRFSATSLVDYGFAYRRDPNFPQDDLTWFLFEKRG